MNKELIKKYKKEFDYWLDNPDNLLFYDEHHNGWYNLHYDYQWNCTVEEVEEFGKYGYVINDEYVEFRKALAEGKIIQYLEQYPNMWHEVQEPDFNLHPTCYRIKPDEPKFKVGDFVTNESLKITRQITKVNDDFIYFKEGSWALPHVEGFSNKLILWTPIKGEWCWFWDKCTPHRPTLRQYDIFPEEYGEENMFHDSEQNPFDFCEPFLNSRPSHLKDK